LLILEQSLRELEARRLEELASTFASEKLRLNGQGNSQSAAPRAITASRERSSLSTTTELAGKNPHKVHKCGALRARQLAKRLVRGGVDEARVILGWAPGGDAPFLIEASTCQGGLNMRVPDKWFSIKSIVRDLELHERDWVANLLAGYFCQASAPWER
jgi:S-adenosylmethionine synthetase, C-terminal domain